jgi:hypothetical protein
MIDLRNHYGFTRQPFGKDLAPSMLHQHAACSEAAVRIGWCVAECALGVITGEEALCLDRTRSASHWTPFPIRVGPQGLSPGFLRPGRLPPWWSGHTGGSTE